MSSTGRRSGHYRVVRHSPAPPAAVWSLLDQVSTWPQWQHLDRATLAACAASGTDDTAPEWELVVGRTVTRIRIVERAAGRRLRYRTLELLGMRSYEATVDLAPSGTGTTITWQATFRPKVPGTARLWGWYLTRLLGRAVDRLAERAVAPPA